MKIIPISPDSVNKEISVGGIYDVKLKMITFTAYEPGDYYIVENPAVFKDLKGYEWAEEYILSLASKGIIYGKGNEMFAPEDCITRAETAIMLDRLYILILK